MKHPQELPNILIFGHLSKPMNYPVEISAPYDVNVVPELPLDGQQVLHQLREI